MMSSASDPQRSAGKREQEPTGSASRTPVDPALLERVLQQTLKSLGGGEPADPAEVAALTQVARRHRGQPLNERIAAEMVRAVLRGPLESLAPSPDAWEAMTAEIARTLGDDPAARERLDSLWKKLAESEP